MEVGGADDFILVGQSSTDKGDRGRGLAGFTLSYAICLALRGPWTGPVSNIFTGSTVVGPALTVNMQHTLQISMGEPIGIPLQTSSSLGSV